jgi:hypothetical protein
VAAKGKFQKDKKSRKGITLEMKEEITEKSGKGGKTSVLGTEYGLSQTTISTNLLNKDKMKATKVSDASTRMIKGREKVAEMEKLLFHWIRDRQM